MVIGFSAGACPNLTGTYDCPAWKEQPAKKFVVSQKDIKGGKQYTFTYIYKNGKRSNRVFEATENFKLHADGQKVKCTDEDKVSFINTKNKDQSEDVLMLSPRDTLVMQKMSGEKIIECPRIAAKK